VETIPSPPEVHASVGSKASQTRANNILSVATSSRRGRDTSSTDVDQLKDLQVHQGNPGLKKRVQNGVDIKLLATPRRESWWHHFTQRRVAHDLGQLREDEAERLESGFASNEHECPENEHESGERELAAGNHARKKWSRRPGQRQQMHMEGS
jgi:hypothetical protein